jgi:hypothetical protein
VNWITKRAFGNERHLGFDASEFDEATFRRIHVPVKHAYYMSRDFRPGRDASWVKIERGSDDSELEIYLRYLTSGPDEPEFLRSLVRLEIEPVEVPWPVDSRAGD